jgi:hypothetical protein
MPDINKFQVGTFLRLSVNEYKATLNGAQPSAAMVDDVLERAAHSWFNARKEKKKPRKPIIADEGQWIESLKSDPAMAGVEVDKEVAKCQFWCRNQTPPVVASRKRITNWLNRADRIVGKEVTKAPLPNPGPAGWLDWARANLDGWRRFAEEAAGIPIPPWHLLDKDERFAITNQMKGKPLA